MVHVPKAQIASKFPRANPAQLSAILKSGLKPLFKNTKI